jgi:hypothetical protein
MQAMRPLKIVRHTAIRLRDSLPGSTNPQIIPGIQVALERSNGQISLNLSHVMVLYHHARRQIDEQKRDSKA